MPVGYATGIFGTVFIDIEPAAFIYVRTGDFCRGRIRGYVIPRTQINIAISNTTIVRSHTRGPDVRRIEMRGRIRVPRVSVGETRDMRRFEKRQAAPKLHRTDVMPQATPRVAPRSRGGQDEPIPVIRDQQRRLPEPRRVMPRGEREKENKHGRPELPKPEHKHRR